MDDNPLSDPNGGTASIRRRIPSVSEVVEELARRLGVDRAERASLFPVAQQVCSEELRAALHGTRPAAALPELVEKAARLLRRELPGAPAASVPPSLGWDADQPFGEIAPESAAPAGGLDLFAEPAAERPGVVIPPSRREPPARGEEAPEPLRLSPPPPPPRRRPMPARTAVPSFGSSAPRRPRRGRALLIVLAFLAVAAAGGYYAYLRRPDLFGRRAAPPAPAVPARRVRPPAPAAGSGAAGAPAPALATVEVAPPPAPHAEQPAPALVRAPEPRPAAPPPAAVRPAGRSAVMVSPDWAGKAPAFLLHFSSYRLKANADRDAARLSREFGRRAHVLSVNLGAKGTWYRVLLGGFSSEAEALGYRKTLTDKKTPGVGFVYEVVGPDSRRR